MAYKYRQNFLNNFLVLKIKLLYTKEKVSLRLVILIGTILYPTFYLKNIKI